MTTSFNQQPLYAEVREDFIDHRRFTSAEFARLEMERLWTATWHWACREEELPQVGDYLVYDIGDQSVIVVNSGEGRIEAFHNVCPHRGRRLLSGRGKITRFHCIFHAWQWDLHGDNTRILDEHQWQGCANMRRPSGVTACYTAIFATAICWWTSRGWWLYLTGSWRIAVTRLRTWATCAATSGVLATQTNR